MQGMEARLKMETISPIELENAQLPRGWKGFREGAVRALLAQAARALETLKRENRELTVENETLKTQVRRFETQEQSMTEALILAQRASDDLRNAAQQKAEATILDAQNSAAEIIRQAEVHAQRTLFQTEAVKEEAAQFRTHFKQLLEGYLEQIERQDPKPHLTVELGRADASQG